MERADHWIRRNRWLIVGAIAAALAFSLLRTQATALPAGGLDALVGGGDPLVVEFYSNT